MANFHEVMDVNQRTMPKRAKEAKAEVKEMRHERSVNGGHVFTHHMHSVSGSYHEPETHTFGAEEGHKALAHFAEHAGLSEHMAPAEAEPEDDEDSAAGAAT